MTGVRTGTLGPKVAGLADSRGHEVLGWDRDQHSPDDPGAVHAHVAQTQPEAILHLALGSPQWAGELARAAGQRDIPMLFTSSVMVFAQRPDGPYDIWSPRTADTDYGRYKIACEDAIWAANPAAMVARIGYQIDPDGRGNNMVAHLDAQQQESGRVLASDRWIPATSFMVDTAAALLGLLAEPERGLHHLDANAEDAWSYQQLVRALAVGLHRDWEVADAPEPVHDQRLVGPRRIRPLSDRLRA